MTTVRDLLCAVEEIYPKRFAMKDDNFGLMVGALRRRVTACAVSLDPDATAIEFAKRARAGVLLSHHPLFFKDKGKGKDKGMRAGLAILAAHTNCDFAPGGLCDELARRLGLSNLVPLVKIGSLPVARIGELPRGTSLSSWLTRLKRLFGQELRLVGRAKKIRRVAVCTGSGADLIPAAIAADCDAFVTGDIKYHAARDAEEHSAHRSGGFLLVDGGHFGTERFFVELTIGKLRGMLPGLRWIPVEAKTPFTRGMR